MKRNFLVVIVFLVFTSIKSQKEYTFCEAEEAAYPDSIEYLNISNSRINYLEFLKNYKNLKTLDISDNSLNLLIFDYHLPKLEKLVLSNNNIESIVLVADSLPNLKELNLSNNSISKYHSNLFDGFNKLEKVNISNNSLEKLPKSIFTLENLKELNISSNYYIQIKDTFQSKKLKKITAKFCYFKKVPPAIQKIKYLRILDISHNQIENINIKLGKEDFTFLQSLDISFNQLASIDFISKLKNVKYFQGQRNKIKKLPKSLNPTLTLFDVSYNRISTFNSYHLDSIEYFLISNNSLSLKSLTITLNANNKYIDFGGNDIESINFINKRTGSVSTHIIIPKHTLFEIDEPSNKISIEQ